MLYPIFLLSECFYLVFFDGITTDGATSGEYQNQGTAGTIQPDAGGACEEGRGQAGDDCVSREGEVQSVAQAGT